MCIRYVNYGIFLHGFNIKNYVNSQLPLFNITNVQTKKKLSFSQGFFNHSNSVANIVSKQKREKNQQLVSSVN